MAFGQTQLLVHISVWRITTSANDFGPVDCIVMMLSRVRIRGSFPVCMKLSRVKPAVD